jgi:hypothetical protein
MNTMFGRSPEPALATSSAHSAGASATQHAKSRVETIAKRSVDMVGSWAGGERAWRRLPGLGRFVCLGCKSGLGGHRLRDYDAFIQPIIFDFLPLWLRHCRDTGHLM